MVWIFFKHPVYQGNEKQYSPIINLKLIETTAVYIHTNSISLVGVLADLPS